MNDTTTDINPDLEHDDCRDSPDREQTTATAATSPTASSGERTTAPRPFLCDDPASLTDDPHSVLE